LAWPKLLGPFPTGNTLRLTAQCSVVVFGIILSSETNQLDTDKSHFLICLCNGFFGFLLFYYFSAAALKHQNPKTF